MAISNSSKKEYSKHLIFITLLLSVFLIYSMIFAIESNADTKSGNFIKVGLRYGTLDKTALLESPDGFFIYEVKGDTVTSVKNIKDHKIVELAVSSGTVIVRDISGAYITNIAADGSQIIASVSYASDNGYFIFSGKKYRGGIMPYINAAGQMNIIDLIDIEDYVEGVVSAEIGSRSHMEALKAQAVATRSFVGVNEGLHASQGFDVCSTAHCQVYSGVDAEYEYTNNATDATTGEMIYYKGKPVVAFYFANSGGYTENCEDVWVAPLGYLRSIRDEFSPEYKWEVKLTRAQITSALKKKGIGDVTEISIDKINPSGYVSFVTVKGTEGEITAKKDNIRSLFKPAVFLKSRVFNIKNGKGDLFDRPSPSNENFNYYAYNSSGMFRVTESINIVSERGLHLLPLNGLSMLDDRGIKITASDKASFPVEDPVGSVTLTEDSDELIISGRGYGHGVGMSQQGAQEMGKQGYSYIDILKYYYKDIEVR